MWEMDARSKGVSGLRLHWALQLGGWGRSFSSIPGCLCGSTGRLAHLSGLSLFGQLLAQESVGLEKSSNPFHLQINPKRLFPTTIAFPVLSIFKGCPEVPSFPGGDSLWGDISYFFLYQLRPFHVLFCKLT